MNAMIMMISGGASGCLFIKTLSKTMQAVKMRKIMQNAMGKK